MSFLNITKQGVLLLNLHVMDEDFAKNKIRFMN